MFSLLLSSSALSTRTSAKFSEAVTRACWESSPDLSSFNMSKYSRNLAATPRMYEVAFFLSSFCITDMNICKHFIWTYRDRQIKHKHLQCMYICNILSIKLTITSQKIYRQNYVKTLNHLILVFKIMLDKIGPTQPAVKP